MKSIRRPSNQEFKLIKLLIRRAIKTLPLDFDWETGLKVRSMQDEGMGSLILFPQGIVVEGRKFAERVNEYQFRDADGVDVIASLNLDTKGELFELDVWKFDFSPLIHFPGKLQ